MTTVLKATSKGQITLPAKWRKNFTTDQFIATQKGNILEIAPLDLTKMQTQDELTVFDALRDNNGKGIAAKDLAALLKKMQ
ncbi:MAG: AbrB/MazE/SpoVT family DNA-binding domain-containing protein [Candidatus Komeilibacteria bacterium]|nr:AbrB/MazE/SpoVT family DNA-binding domain-containing protein [Candidatus Komeilibacteria bacterium]